MKFIKKYWFIIFIILFTILRFLFSYKLPSYYLDNLTYDDKLMINQLSSLLEGNYLGEYSNFTLIKGMIFPLVLFLTYIMKISYSVLFTTLYILGCLFILYSTKKIESNRKFLLFFYILLLFNPISYSCELFQRLYCNTLSFIEVHFFLGIVILIIASKELKIRHYIFLGIIISLMYLTRDDNIWIIVLLFLLSIYKLYKNIHIKNIIIVCIPIIIFFLSIQIISYVNYKYYNIYTYNELNDTNFNKTYKKLLQIKDDKKIDKVAIPKSTFEKIISNSDILKITKEELDEIYKSVGKYKGEIDNGNIIWVVRSIFYRKNNFKNGKEANKFFQQVSNELDSLFEKKIFEKEFITPSIFMNTPTINEIKEIPINYIKAIIYTSTYQNVKTLSNERVNKYYFSRYDENIRAYNLFYSDYRHAENIVPDNPLIYNIIKNFYKCFTVLLSILSLIIYIKNIKKKDKLNIINHLLIISYLLVLFIVVYTHTTAFHAIRYRYLANIYVIQFLFIFFNIARIIKNNNE